ncbi:MFS transporter [Streptomyces sp. NPDC058011]|uniref:MFS transporter n=1 Tax=Streptomyces sp. NPDC058011 TaxID=3346305 RepID=UPI0036EC7FBF
MPASPTESGTASRSPKAERLWTDRRWLLYTAAAASARLPATMLPLGLVLAGQSATGSFTAGSVLAGAYAGAAALTAPWRGRRLDRTVLPGGLTLPLMGGALMLAVLAAALAVRAPVVALAVPAAAAAVATAGAPGGMRSLLPVLWGKRVSTRAFAGDSAITEITWVAGPALTALLATVVGTIAPIACAALFWVAACVLVRRIPGHRKPSKSPVKRRSTTGLVRAVLPLLVLNLSVGVNLGTLDVALPALLHERGESPAGSGLIIAALSLTSAATVLLLTLPAAENFLAQGTEARRSVLCHACYGLAFLAMIALPPYAGVLVIAMAAGCFLGPAVSFTFALVPQRVTPDRYSEAFALFMSTNALGTAAGALTAGLLTEHLSVSLALLAAALPLLAALAAAPALWRRRPSHPAGANL